MKKVIAWILVVIGIILCAMEIVSIIANQTFSIAIGVIAIAFLIIGRKLKKAEAMHFYNKIEYSEPKDTKGNDSHILTKNAKAPKIALIFITLGCLVIGSIYRMYTVQNKTNSIVFGEPRWSSTFSNRTSFEDYSIATIIEESASVPYKKGVSSESSYENEFFGIRFTAPEGAAMTPTVDLLENIEMSVTAQDGMTNINLMVMEVPAGLTEKQIIKILQTTLLDIDIADINISITLDDETTSMELAGQEFTVISCTAETSGIKIQDTFIEISGLEIRQDILFCRRNNKILGIYITYASFTVDQKEALLDGFSTIDDYQTDNDNVEENTEKENHSIIGTWITPSLPGEMYGDIEIGRQEIIFGEDNKYTAIQIFGNGTEINNEGTYVLDGNNVTITINDVNTYAIFYGDEIVIDMTKSLLEMGFSEAIIEFMGESDTRLYRT